MKIELNTQEITKHIRNISNLSIKDSITIETTEENRVLVKALNKDVAYYEGFIDKKVNEEFSIEIPIDTFYKTLIAHSKEEKVTIRINKKSISCKVGKSSFKLPRLNTRKQFPSLKESPNTFQILHEELKESISKVDFIVPSSVDRSSKDIYRTITLDINKNTLASTAFREYFIGRTERRLIEDFESKRLLLPLNIILFIQRLTDTFIAFSEYEEDKLLIQGSNYRLLSVLPRGKYPNIDKLFKSVSNNKNHLCVDLEEFSQALSKSKIFQHNTGNYIRLTISSNSFSIKARNDVIGSISTDIDNFEYVGKELDILLVGFDMFLAALRKNKKEEKVNIFFGLPGKPVLIEFSNTKYICTSKKVSSISSS